MRKQWMGYFYYTLSVTNNTASGILFILIFFIRNRSLWPGGIFQPLPGISHFLRHMIRGIDVAIRVFGNEPL